MRAAYLFLLLCLLPSLSFAQSPDEQTQQAFEAYQASFPQEKAFLHTDKPAYLLGETLWFKAYLMDAQQHFASPLSNMLYVELIGPLDTVITRLNVWIIQGEGKGDFALPLDGQAGQYRLRAYTQYMRNYPAGYFFEQEVSVYSPLLQSEASPQSPANDTPTPRRRKNKDAPIQVEFFPEGGDLIADLPAWVAFRAKDKEGNTIRISGRLLDGAGEEISQFETRKAGMGSFLFKPTLEADYKMEVEWEGETLRFPLPEIQERGLSLQMRYRGSDALVTLRSNLLTGLQGAYLVGHIRGQIFLRLPGQMGAMQRLKLPLAELPEGIAHLTLFDAEGRPQAERLLYVHHPETRPRLEVSSLDSIYQQRKLTEVQLALTNAEKVSLGGQLSVSVYDVSFDDLAKQPLSIEQYLLFASDLAVGFPDMQALLQANSRSSRDLIDLHLMTQGWRRFTWRDVLETGAPALKFPNEEGASFGGQVVRGGALSQPVQAEVILSGFTDKFFMERTITDEEGRFYFSGFNFLDSLKLTLMAGVYKKKKGSRRDTEGQTISLTPTGNRNVDIRITDYGWPEVQSLAEVSPSTEEDAQAKALVQKEEDWAESLSEAYAELKEIDLEEVVIEAKQKSKADENFDRGGEIYGRPDAVLNFDSIPRARTALSIFDVIQGRVPGIEIIGPIGERVVRIRGNSSISQSPVALFLLDGAPVSPITINTLDVNRVASVEVVRGLRATSVYGEQGAGGIVAIYTRRAGDGSGYEVREPGTINLFHPGYYQAREFAAPWYEEELPEHVTPDFRTTLHWEPELSIDKNGQANLKFYTGDRKGTYVVVVQGMTDEGEPVVGRTVFEVE